MLLALRREKGGNGAESCGIMIDKAIITVPTLTVPTLPPKKQGRHFAKGRKPVETQWIFQGIMIGKAN